MESKTSKTETLSSESNKRQRVVSSFDDTIQMEFNDAPISSSSSSSSTSRKTEAPSEDKSSSSAPAAGNNHIALIEEMRNEINQLRDRFVHQPTLSQNGQSNYPMQIIQSNYPSQLSQPSQPSQHNQYNQSSQQSQQSQQSQYNPYSQPSQHQSSQYNQISLPSQYNQHMPSSQPSQHNLHNQHNLHSQHGYSHHDQVQQQNHRDSTNDSLQYNPFSASNPLSSASSDALVVPNLVPSTYAFDDRTSVNTAPNQS